MKQPHNRSVLFYVVLAWLPVAAALFRVWVHQDAVQMGYALSAQEHRREELRATLRELEVEVASARSPGRLVRIATQLGLRPPAPGQIVQGGALTPFSTASASHLARADMSEARHAAR